MEPQVAVARTRSPSWRPTPSIPVIVHTSPFQQVYAEFPLGPDIVTIPARVEKSGFELHPVEHQHDGNPHFHGHAHVVNIYQHGTLEDVARAIRQGFLDSDTLKSYCMHICNEEHTDIAKHNADIDELEKEWPRYKGDRHKPLSQLPAIYKPDHSVAALWSADRRLL